LSKIGTGKNMVVKQVIEVQNYAALLSLLNPEELLEDVAPLRNYLSSQEYLHCNE
jgi:hypothetical protein